MDNTTLAEEISRDWRHIRAVLTVALGDEWAEQIDDAEGAFTLVEGRLLAQFDGVYYSTDENAKRAVAAGDVDVGRWIGHGGCSEGLRAAPLALVCRRSPVFRRARPIAARRRCGHGCWRCAQRALRFAVGAGDPGPKSRASGMQALPRRIAA